MKNEPSNQLSGDSGRLKQFGVEYQYRGARWAADLWALDEEDAGRKLRAMAHGVIVGEIKAVIRVPTGIQRLLRWLGIDGDAEKS